MGKFIRGTRGTLRLGDIVASRVIGIVPFMVFFEVPDTTSSAVLPGDEYRDIKYEWLFGESAGYGAALHSFGAKVGLSTRNYATGHVVGHLFTEPGTFTVQCTGKDVNGSGIETIEITAREGVAPIEWDGPRTILVSTSGTFTNPEVTGTPTQITFSTWAALITSIQGVIDTVSAYTGAYRVAFRKGETFPGETINGGQYIRSIAGPGILCSYDDTGFYPEDTNATITSSAGSTSGGLINLGNQGAAYVGMSVCKIVGLDIDCSATPITSAVSAISPIASCDALAIHKCNFIGVNFVCITLAKDLVDSTASVTEHHIWDEFSVTSCTQTGQRTGGTNFVSNTFIFAVCRRGYISDNSPDAIGNVQTAPASSHVIRIEWADRLVVSHNRLGHQGSGRHAFKCHSDEVIAWGVGAQGTGAFTPSATKHDGQGEYRRPFDPVDNGYCLADVQPPIFRCITSGLTAATEPVWNTTIGQDTTDNLAVWRCVDPTTIYPSWDKTWDTTIDPRTGLAWGYTSHDIIFADNLILGSSSANAVSIGALDLDDYSLVIRWVVEDNFLNSDEVGSLMQAPLWIFAKRGVVRNNVINFSRGVNNPQMIYAGLRNYNGPGTEISAWAADDVQIYNNSGYINATVSSIIDGIRLDPYAKNIVAKNNVLFVDVGGKTSTMIQGTGHAGFPVVASHNTGNVGTPTTNPIFSGSLTTVPISGWNITDAGSYVIGAGDDTVRLFKDAFDIARPTIGKDMGASQRV